MWLRIIGYITAGCIVLLALLWATSSMLIAHFANKHLAPLELTLTEESHITFNPFLLGLTIENLAVESQAQPSHRAQLKQAYIQLSLAALLRKQLNFQSFELSGLDLTVIKQDERYLILNQVVFDSQRTSEPSTTTQTQAPWSLAIPRFDLLKSNLTLKAESVHQLVIDSLALSDLVLNDKQQTLEMLFGGKFNQATMKTGVYADLNTQKFNGVTEIDTLQLAPLIEFLPENMASLMGALTVNTQWQLHMGDDLFFNLAQGQFKLDRLSLAEPSVKQSLAADQVLIDIPALMLENNEVMGQLTASVNMLSVKPIGEEDGAIGEDEALPEVTLEKFNLPKASFEHSSSHWKLVSPTIALERLRIHYPLSSDLDARQTLEVEQLLIDVSSAQLQDDKLNANLGAQVSQFNLLTNNAKDRLFAFEHLNVPQVAVEQSQQVVSIAIPDIVLDKIIASQLASEQSPLFGANQLSFKDVKFEQEVSTNNASVQMDNIELVDFDVYMHMAQQTLQNLVVLPQGEESEKAEQSVETSVVTTSEEESVPSSVFNVVLNQFTTDGRIVFEDTNSTPGFSEEVSLSKVSLSNVNSADLAEKALFSLAGKTDKHGDFTLSGDYQPFNPKMNMTLKGDINELALPKLVGYFAKQAQVSILSGQLDSQLDVKVIDNQIAGESKLFVRGLELAKEKSEQSGVEQDTSVISLNTALGMLQDSKGNLDLDVPLSGDVSSPEFGLQSFVSIITQKAIMLATEQYLMQTVVPYGNILSVAKIAGEMMLKVKLEDLSYPAKQIAPGPEQQLFIENLIKLLTDQPDQQVKICAIATPEDLPEEAIESAQDSVNYLHKISDQRSQAFKDYLIENSEVSSKRLLLCHGQVEQESTKGPRIVFTL